MHLCPYGLSWGLYLIDPVRFSALMMDSLKFRLIIEVCLYICAENTAQ